MIGYWNGGWVFMRTKAEQAARDLQAARLWIGRRASTPDVRARVQRKFYTHTLLRDPVKVYELWEERAR